MIGWEVYGEPDALCPQCDGDGYDERFNDDQSDVIITPCSACFPEAAPYPWEDD